MSKKLYREEDGAMVVGVVAGLANYFKQDPNLFRVLAILFLVLTGILSSGGLTSPKSLFSSSELM